MNLVRTGRGKTPIFSMIVSLGLIIGISSEFSWTSLATVAAQEPTELPSEGPSTIRAVHAVQGAQNVDVPVDGQPIAQDLAFGTASEYAPIAPGAHQVQIVPTGQPAEAALSIADVDSSAGTGYIVTALGAERG
jgi:Domain of unknown function (DUF4397)